MRRGPLDGLLDRARAVIGSAPVLAVRRVLDRYEAAGGGLLASGLAYVALFAIVPAVVLVAVAASVFIADPATRSSVISTIATVLPPVRDIANAVVDEVERNATSGSVIGVVALIWGASRFVVAFQDAIARVMGGVRRRGVLASNLTGLGAVLLLVVAILGSTLLAGVSAFLDAGRELPVVAVLDRAIGLAVAILPLVAAIGAAAAVYRLVPIPAPSWRALAVPAAVVGLVLSVLARVFIYVAPRLIGAAALLGTLASVFAALAWLSLSFQALLIGAAWTSEREAARQALPRPAGTVPPGAAGSGPAA